MNLGERDAHAKWLDVVAVMHGLLCDFSEDLKEVTDQRDRLYREQPTADDSELQGELDLLKDCLKEQKDAIEGFYHEFRKVGDVLRESDIPYKSGESTVSAVQQLADALTAERAKVAELQHALETANAANAHRAQESQLEPVGWIAAYPDDIPTKYQDCTWYSSKKEQCPLGHRRRLFAGPAEPLEVTP